MQAQSENLKKEVTFKSFVAECMQPTATSASAVAELDLDLPPRLFDSYEKLSIEHAANVTHPWSRLWQTCA